jgi:rubrerythrin
MKEFKDINDILDFAIGEEQAAVEFYMVLAAKSKNDEIRMTFHEFAEEEMKHKANLIRVKDQGSFGVVAGNVTDLKIADYLVDVKAAPDLPYQEALILAMKKEKAAFKLYTALAYRATDPEKSKHKLRFEIEYDEYILREN